MISVLLLQQIVTASSRYQDAKIPGPDGTVPQGQTYPLLSPPFPVSWNLNESTIVMPCNTQANNGGWSNASFFASFGIIEYDWSNSRYYWTKAKPMDCQERLTTQAAMTNAMNPKAKIFVYRNIVKALPWFSDVRIKINDPEYSGWFLHDANGSSLYYDRPIKGDCGGIQCGEYLWDHRNASARDYIVDTVIGGRDAMSNENISGIYLDDFWSNFPFKLPWARPKTDCSLSSTGGPSEIYGGCIDQMGLSASDVEDIAENWMKTMTASLQKIVELGGFSWQMFWFPDGDTLSRTTPRSASFFRRECAENSTSQTKPIMFRFSNSNLPGKNKTAPSFKVDLAAFLLIRSEYAWIGYSWEGCDNTYERPAEIDFDYGKPVDDRCIEDVSGVFRREWTNAFVYLDTNINSAKIIWKKIEDGT